MPHKFEAYKDEILTAIRDRVMSALQCSLDEEREKGIKKGRREGRMEGHREGTQETALRMIQNGFDVKTICLCTGLTSKEVKELCQKAKNIKPD